MLTVNEIIIDYIKPNCVSFFSGKEDVSRFDVYHQYVAGNYYQTNFIGTCVTASGAMFIAKEFQKKYPNIKIICDY